MYEVALEILNDFKKHGYEAYIVGGYPRDKYLGIISEDIDICTNAKPDEIKKIFNSVDTKYSNYGNVVVYKNNYSFQITTFRKDCYLKNRNDVIIEYVDTLKEDLIRRDFIINTLCIDSDGNYVDLMNAKEDIDNKKIRLIRDYMELVEDPLRIIRAVRFMVMLNFDFDAYLEGNVIKYGYLIKNLKVSKIMSEIDKIDIHLKDKFYLTLEKFDLLKYIERDDL